MDARTALALVLTVVLVVANGFFVAAEYAFVRVRKTQLDEIAQQGSARARLASRVLDRLDQPVQTAHYKQLGHLGVQRLQELTELLRAARSQVA